MSVIPKQGADTFYSFGCREMVISEYFEDPSQAVWQECYGIQNISISPEMVSEELLGNDTVMEMVSLAKSFTFEIEQGKISLPCYAVMTGGAYTPTSTGVNPSLIIPQSNFNPYFMIKFQALDTNGGSIVIQMNKVQLTSILELSFAQEGFMTVSASGAGIADSQGNLLTFTDISPATLLTT